MTKIDVYVKILMITLGIPILLIPVDSCHASDVVSIFIVKAGIVILMIWAIKGIIKY